MPLNIVTILTNAQSIAGGYAHSLAVAADGTLWGWGLNDFYQVGDGTTTNRNAPVQIGTDTNWSKVAAGSYHSVALKTDGTAYAWGKNSGGQCGIAGGGVLTTPTLVSMPETATLNKIAAGGEHSLFADTLTLRKVFGCGPNTLGQIGGGDLTEKTTPTEITYFANTDHIAMGHDFSMATTTGAIRVAGFTDISGQAGVGYSSGFKTVPSVGVGEVFTSITASRRGGFCVTQAGDVIGFCSYDAGDELNKTASGGRYGWTAPPVAHPSNYSYAEIRTDAPLAVKVAAGYDHLFILGNDGYLYSYGANDYNQLARPTTTDAERWTVTRIDAAGAGWVDIACGEYHTLATLGS